jgi:hypothetical protein
MSNDPGIQPDTPDHTTQPTEGKRPWVRPELKELPRLTDLTLQTGTAIGGGGSIIGGTGSTVF